MIGSAAKLLGYPDRMTDYFLGRAVTPVTIEVHPSGRCNQACSYCAAPKSGQVMSDSDAAWLAGEIERAGIEGVTLSGGGEPTLGPWLAFLGRTFAAGMITNGSVPVESYAGLRWVRFSMDSEKPDVYREVRGVERPACLDENFRRAVAETRVGVQMVITRKNLNGVVHLTSWARRFGASYIEIRPDDYSSNPPWFGQQLTSLLTSYNRHERFKVIIRSDKLKPHKAGPCRAGNFRMVVAPDLKCYVCACGGYRRGLGRLGDGATLQDIIHGERRSVAVATDRITCPSSCVGASLNAALDGLPEREFL